MTENVKRKEGDDLMTCFVIHVSLLSLHIFRNSCFTKRLVAYHPLTNLSFAAVGFIKIPFINKGIEFIDLHSIFKDNSVISSIPNYFNNSETPIICYKYNKPIRSTIFNFNKIVNDLDIDSNTPAS